MRSDSAQFFSARALRRSSRTMSMTPSRAFSALPEPPAASSSRRPRTPYTMSSKSFRRAALSASGSFPPFTSFTASNRCAMAMGVFRSSQRAS